MECEILAMVTWLDVSIVIGMLGILLFMLLDMLGIVVVKHKNKMDFLFLTVLLIIVASGFSEYRYDKNLENCLVETRQLVE